MNAEDLQIERKLNMFGKNCPRSVVYQRERVLYLLYDDNIQNEIDKYFCLDEHQKI